MAKAKGKHGGKRDNSGRNSSAVNILREQATRVVNWTGQTPAEFFQSIMQDITQPIAVRLDAAKCGAPLVHQKQAEAHQHSGQLTLPPPLIVLNDHE